MSERLRWHSDVNYVLKLGIQMGKEFAGLDRNYPQLSEASVLIASAEDNERLHLYFWFEEGVRDNIGTTDDYLLVRSRLRELVECLSQ